MKTENFERAKAIEKEIQFLVEYKKPLTTNREKELSIDVCGSISKERYEQKSYSHKYSSCPDFLKEQIQDDLNFIADRILAKINKRIAELEKEFESL